MRERYPAFVAVQECSERRVWGGMLWPLPPFEEFAAVVADLAEDRLVDVRPGGQVRHLRTCDADHGLPSELKLCDWRCGFHIRLIEREKQPRLQAYCISPDFALRYTPLNHPHLYSDGSLCVMHPELDDLPSGPPKVAAFLDAVAIYLVKHIVWERTGSPLIPGGGLWIGAAVDHEGRLVKAHLRED